MSSVYYVELSSILKASSVPEIKQTVCVCVCVCLYSNANPKMRIKWVKLDSCASTKKNIIVSLRHWCLNYCVEAEVTLNCTGGF